jgi:hypothetical protein
VSVRPPFALPVTPLEGRARTGEDGRVVFEGLPRGTTYAVTARASDEVDASPSVDVVATNESMAVDLVLPDVASRRIVGAVTASDGTPLRGVAIFVGASLFPREFSREGGRFALDLPREDVVLTFECPNHVPAQVAVAASTEPSEAPLRVTLETGLAIDGVVKTTNGDRIPHAAIQWQVLATNRQGSLRADEQGTFRLTGLEAGNVFFVAACPDGRRNDGVAAPAGGGVEIVIEPVAELTVSIAFAEPGLAGDWLTSVQIDADATAFAATRHAAHDREVRCLVPCGPRLVRISSDATGVWLQDIDLEPGGRDRIEVVLRRGSTVGLRVTRRGVPVAKYGLYAMAALPDGRRIGVGNTKTDREGLASMVLAAGDHVLRDGFGGRELDRELRVNGDVDLEIELEP